MQLLAKWVADKEKDEAKKSGKEFTEIELPVGGNEHSERYPRDPAGLDYKVAFTGRLLASTEEWHFTELESGLRVSRPTSTNPVVEVYEMRDGRLVVYRCWETSYSGGPGGATCLVYSDFQTLRDDPTALQTGWYVDDREEAAVPPFRTRTARGEQEITEDVEWEAYDLHFQKEISDALGAEMIVRID